MAEDPFGGVMDLATINDLALSMRPVMTTTAEWEATMAEVAANLTPYPPLRLVPPLSEEE